jgi:hypothetical protein
MEFFPPTNEDLLVRELTPDPSLLYMSILTRICFSKKKGERLTTPFSS